VKETIIKLFLSSLIENIIKAGENTLPIKEQKLKHCKIKTHKNFGKS